jgi:5,10-methylenetetrahydromethanopterin reductase
MSATVPRLSVGLAPGRHTIDLAKLAVDLGCERVYLYDSAAVYEDIFIWLARLAELTDARLGAAVLVPNLRHVMTTASAIATLEDLAPGRFVYGLGTGESARTVLNKKRLSLATTRRYFEQLRGLLHGDVVEIDGERCQMIHWPGLAPPRPLDVPLLWSAFGPKSLAVAQEVADGVMTVSDEPSGLDWTVRMINGTILDPGEDLTTPRVHAAVGPWLVLPYHVAAHWRPEALDGMPRGAEWRAAYEAERPLEQRHLVVHEGHATHVNVRDEMLVEVADQIPFRSAFWIDTRDALRGRAEYAASNGVTELLYAPVGPNAADELRRMAALLTD